MPTKKIIIDKNSLAAYSDYYFRTYPRRKIFPIKGPIPPSLNEWMIMKRYKMNHEKQVWKEFAIWLIGHHGLGASRISKCQITLEYFFPNKRKHDADNYTPKNLFDGFVIGGLLEDDDFYHVESLTIRGDYSKENPRTEISFVYREENYHAT